MSKIILKESYDVCAEIDCSCNRTSKLVDISPTEKETIVFADCRKFKSPSEYTDKEFLLWLHDRIVFVYNESVNTDFVKKFKKIIEDNFD